MQLTLWRQLAQMRATNSWRCSLACHHPPRQVQRGLRAQWKAPCQTPKRSPSQTWTPCQGTLPSRARSCNVGVLVLTVASACGSAIPAARWMPPSAVRRQRHSEIALHCRRVPACSWRATASWRCRTAVGAAAVSSCWAPCAPVCAWTRRTARRSCRHPLCPRLPWRSERSAARPSGASSTSRPRCSTPASLCAGRHLRTGGRSGRTGATAARRCRCEPSCSGRALQSARLCSAARWPKDTGPSC
mmetsp:Transcript_58214/g.160922  ORF Transcript_58214/g.160922 Transcript_58214/m.160922 type:complete len:245 (+) Transcript_58214:1614-2348(+)